VFEEFRGFFRMHLREALSGCECCHDPADEFIKGNSHIHFGHAWKYALGFRWGGNFNEMQAAWMAATAYARATDGVVLDDQELKFRAAAEAHQVVDDIVRDMPKIEEILRELKQRRSKPV
jgi:hypothetical protein